LPETIELGAERYAVSEAVGAFISELRAELGHAYLIGLDLFVECDYLAVER